MRSFGGEAVMTSPDCASGTDRIAEIAARMREIDIFVNVQGDEPEMSGHSIDRVIELLEEHPELPMATVATPIRHREQLSDPACVKVVFPIHARRRRPPVGQRPVFQPQPNSLCPRMGRQPAAADPPHFYLHLGLYAYRRDFLAKLTRLPRSPLEKLESLEQLRVLAAGYPIIVGVVSESSSGIDTPADYQAFVRRMAGSGPRNA